MIKSIKGLVRLGFHGEILHDVSHLKILSFFFYLNGLRYLHFITSFPSEWVQTFGGTF